MKTIFIIKTGVMFITTHRVSFDENGYLQDWENSSEDVPGTMYVSNEEYRVDNINLNRDNIDVSWQASE